MTGTRTFAAITTMGSPVEYEELDSQDIASLLVAPTWKIPGAYSLFALEVSGNTITAVFEGGSKGVTRNDEHGYDPIYNGQRFVVGDKWAPMNPAGPDAQGLVGIIHTYMRHDLNNAAEATEL